MAIKWIQTRDTSTQDVNFSRTNQTEAELAPTNEESKAAPKQTRDNFYSDRTILANSYYQSFKKNCGDFLVEHSTAIKNAEDLQSSIDKDFTLAQLKSSMIDVVIEQVDDRGIDLRSWLEAADRFHTAKTGLICSTNPLRAAFEELREGFLHELNGNFGADLPETFRTILIKERNEDGIPTGNKISLSTIFADKYSFFKYINDPHVRNALSYTSEHMVQPKLNKEIEEKKKLASEEARSLVMPIATGIATTMAIPTVYGIGRTLMDRFGTHTLDHGTGTLTRVFGNKDLVAKAAAKVFESAGYEHCGANLLTKNSHLLVDSALKNTMRQRITTHLASEAGGKLTGGLLARTTERAMGKALLQATARGTGLLSRVGSLPMLGWRSIFGVGSRALGFMGGPIGLALSIALPFVIDWAVAETRDAFTAAQGKKSENHGFTPFGELIGSGFRGFGRSFS